MLLMNKLNFKTREDLNKDGTNKTYNSVFVKSKVLMNPENMNMVKNTSITNYAKIRDIC